MSSFDMPVSFLNIKLVHHIFSEIICNFSTRLRRRNPKNQVLKLKIVTLPATALMSKARQVTKSVVVQAIRFAIVLVSAAALHHVLDVPQDI